MEIEKTEVKTEVFALTLTREDAENLKRGLGCITAYDIDHDTFLSLRDMYSALEDKL